MKKFLIPGAAAMLVASPAFAQQHPTMDQIVKEIEALSGRVSRLEQDNAQLRSENAELKAMLVPFYVAGSLYGETFEEAAVVDTGPQVNTEETIANREIKAIIAVRMSHFGERVVIEISKVATTEAV